MFDLRPRRGQAHGGPWVPASASRGLTRGIRGPADTGALDPAPKGQEGQGGPACGRGVSLSELSSRGKLGVHPRCPLPLLTAPGAYLREEGIHVACLELELCVGRGVGGIAPPLHLSEVLLCHVAFGQVEPIDKRQDVPGKRVRLTPALAGSLEAEARGRDAAAARAPTSHSRAEAVIEALGGAEAEIGRAHV